MIPSFVNYRLVQNAGEFVVSSQELITRGFYCGHAAVIATTEWLSVAKEAAIRNAAIRCPPMVSHFQLSYDLALSLCSRCKILKFVAKYAALCEDIQIVWLIPILRNVKGPRWCVLDVGTKKVHVEVRKWRCLRMLWTKGIEGMYCLNERKRILACSVRHWNWRKLMIELDEADCAVAVLESRTVKNEALPKNKKWHTGSEFISQPKNERKKTQEKQGEGQREKMASKYGFQKRHLLGPKPVIENQLHIGKLVKVKDISAKLKQASETLYELEKRKKVDVFKDVVEQSAQEPEGQERGFAKGQEDDKADVILKYVPDEARLLKAYGELPESTRRNEGIAGGLDEEDDGPGDDYIEFEDEDIDKL
ncbi:UNVERIFIED_CONTAM: Eukaryotic translation initiation factor 1A [Sesamum calycinum]|uniref:Eukaryotic translation initiation factor 1A n=1 Tax=Sesamum calycinum TaxID=2727403 RepID=A0AAW2JN26_9LAMI